jgi:hypothetical protein
MQALIRKFNYSVDASHIIEKWKSFFQIHFWGQNIDPSCLSPAYQYHDHDALTVSCKCNMHKHSYYVSQLWLVWTWVTFNSITLSFGELGQVWDMKLLHLEEYHPLDNARLACLKLNKIMPGVAKLTRQSTTTVYMFASFTSAKVYLFLVLGLSLLSAPGPTLVRGKLCRWCNLESKQRPPIVGWESQIHFAVTLRRRKHCSSVIT